MTKKIFALVMVVSMFGAIFASGCKKDDTTSDSGTASTSSTTGKTDTGGTTGDASSKTTS